VLERPFGKGRDERGEPFGEPPRDGVRERGCALEARRSHELDGVVGDGVRRGVAPAELVARHAQRRAHGRIELSHGPPAELVDAVVDRPHSLHGAVRDPLRQRAVAPVETGGRGRECPIGVGAVLEDPPNDLERNPPRRSDHRSPRRYSS
jgi:hypothetical protein